MKTTLLISMMSRFLLIFTLLLATAISLIAADPSEQFLSAYQSYQEAENLERSGNTTDALKKYRFAESLLQAISKNDPSWQKPVIEYRLKKTHESIDRLQGGVADTRASENTITTAPPIASPTTSDQGSPSISITPPVGPRGDSEGASKSQNQASSTEIRRLREMVDDLKGQLQEARDTLSAQKHRTGDLENAEWVKKRSELVSNLDVAKRRISDLERDLKSRDSWGKDLKNLQKKLDEAVADKLTAEEQYQGSFKKLSDENADLVKQLQSAQSKVVSATDSKQKIEELTQEVEKGKEAFAQLQAKLDHSEHVSKESFAKNEEIQKQLVETSEKLVVAQKQVERTAPLRDKIKELQAKVAEGDGARHHELTLQADLQALQEDRDRLMQKVTALGVAASEASKVKGLTDETEVLKKSLADLKERLDVGEKEIAKAHAEAAASEKVANDAKALQAKNLADADADRAVLTEDKERLLAKVNQVTQMLKVLKETADSVPSLQKDVLQLKEQLAENSKALEQSAAKLSEEQKASLTSHDEAQRKDQSAKNFANLLRQQNNALQDQLKAALGQIASSVDHSPESGALQDQIKKLQAQMDLNSKNYAESQKQIAEAAKAQPDQQKALNEKEQALAVARDEAVKLQTRLSEATQQITALKNQGEQDGSHLKDLQNQLADRDAKIVRLKKKKGNAADEQMVQENELLRGIVLREIKGEAKKMQAHRLMQEELKRLNVQSDTIQNQITQLAEPAVVLTPQERALFKDANLVVADQGEGAIEASISAPMNGLVSNKILTNGTIQTDTKIVSGTNISTNSLSESNAVASNAPTEINPQSNKPVDTTNAPASLPWEGKFKQLLAQAKTEFDRQDYLQAENTFQEALKLSPDDYFALSNLGVVEFQLGKMKEAEEKLKKASLQSSDSSFALTTLGIVHYRQQRYQDAETVLRKAVAINNQDFTAHNYLGIVLAASGKGKAGESEIMKAIEINPNYADAHFNLAVIYATGKPPAKMLARKHYAKSLELGSPPDPSLEHLIQ